MSTEVAMTLTSHMAFSGLGLTECFLCEEQTGKTCLSTHTTNLLYPSHNYAYNHNKEHCYCLMLCNHHIKFYKNTRNKNRPEEDLRTSQIQNSRQGKTKRCFEPLAAEGSSVHSYFTPSLSVSMVMPSQSMPVCCRQRAISCRRC